MAMMINKHTRTLFLFFVFVLFLFSACSSNQPTFQNITQSNLPTITVDIEKMCPIFQPVCTTNGSSYRNPCEMKYYNATFAYFGTCDVSAKLIAETLCVNEKAFVCTPGDLNVQNSCLADFLNMTVLTNTSCKATPCLETAYVCGSDGYSYNSACDAKKYNITVAHDGLCAANKKTSSVAPSISCTNFSSEPVCGISPYSKKYATYPNKCTALMVNVTNIVAGKCK